MPRWALEVRRFHRADGRCILMVTTCVTFRADIRPPELRSGSHKAARPSARNMIRQRILPFPEIPLDSGLYNRVGSSKQTKNEFVFIVLGGSIDPPFLLKWSVLRKSPIRHHR